MKLDSVHVCPLQESLVSALAGAARGGGLVRREADLRVHGDAELELQGKLGRHVSHAAAGEAAA